MWSKVRLFHSSVHHLDLWEGSRCLFSVLAIELLAACQGIEFLRPLRTTTPLEKVYELVRSVVKLVKHTSAWASCHVVWLVNVYPLLLFSNSPFPGLGSKTGSCLQTSRRSTVFSSNRR